MNFPILQYEENILYLDFLLIKHRTPLPKGIGRKLTEFICILFLCSCFQITSIRGRFIFSNLLVPNFKENLFQMFLRINPDIGQTSRSDSHSNWTRFYLFLQMTRSKWGLFLLFIFIINCDVAYLTFNFTLFCFWESVQTLVKPVDPILIVTGLGFISFSRWQGPNEDFFYYLFL